MISENVGRDWGRATNVGGGFVKIFEYFSYREGRRAVEKANHSYNF